MAVSSNEIGPKILDVLGLPADGVRRLVLTLEAGEPAIIELEIFADRDAGDISTLLQRYKLEALDVSDLRDPAKKFFVHPELPDRHASEPVLPLEQGEDGKGGFAGMRHDDGVSH